MGKPHLENLKHKVASQVGVNLTEGYNGDITTKQAGLIGGNMVRELIVRAEQNLSNTYGTTNQNNQFWGTTTTNFDTTTGQTWF